MITVSVLALKNSVLASIADSRYVFTIVNEFLTQAGRSPLFKVQLIGAALEVKLDSGVFSIRPDVTMNDSGKSDLIIVPSFVGDMKSAVYLNKEFAPWISEQYKN